MGAILAAMGACYRDLSDPNYGQVYQTMESPLHQLIDDLRCSGVTIEETTDPNDDVATHVIVSEGGIEVALALSGVGPFAILMQLDAAGGRHWVVEPGQSQSPSPSPSPLAARIATLVQERGFSLLSRDTLTQATPMTGADGSAGATVYQALFTDSDTIP